MQGIILPEVDQEQLEKIKNERIDEVINDEEIQEIMKKHHLDYNYVRKNLYYFNLYKKDRDNCKNCQGFSSCPKKENHLQFVLKFDKNMNISFGYRKCKYQVELDELVKKYSTREFPNRFLVYKMKDLLDTFAIERQPIVKKMMEFRKNPSEKGLYISGSQGTGKSFILAVFSLYLAKVEDTKSICFIDCGNEFKSLEKFFNENLNYFEAMIDEMKKTQYLFLDDLGKEFKNQFVLENVLLPVLKARKENHLATFISSNYRIRDIRKCYSFSKDSYKLSGELMDLLDTSLVELELNGMPYSKIR